MNQDSLSHEVLAHIARLGGQPGAPPAGDLPAPLAQLFAIEWPDREHTHFGADEDGPCWWAQGIYFHAPQPCDRVDFGFQDRGDKELVRFCHARGRYFVMLDVRDPHPADPLVYHASSGAYSPTLGSGIPLSAFLGALVAQRRT